MTDTNGKSENRAGTRSAVKPRGNPRDKPDDRVDGTKPENPAVEIGGREGPDPVRYGDWEKDGRAIDF